MSWFSKLWGKAKAAKATKGQDYILLQLNSSHGVDGETRELSKDDEYVSIIVRSSRIVNAREWTSKFYGAVHARSHYLHESRGLIEYQTIVSPELLKDLDPAHLDRVITFNKPILGPVPYLGGLSLELGLFSVKGSDLVGPYIDLLSTMASAAGIGAVSAAMPFVAPLRKGFDLLFGNPNQSELEIGVDTTWDKLSTGTWLAILAPKGTAAIDKIKLDLNDYGLIDDEGAAYRDQPYVVFSIVGSKRRDDWMTIPELKQAWDAIGAAATTGRLNDAETLFHQFVHLTNWSPDLIPEDARRLVAKAKARLPNLQADRAISMATPKGTAQESQSRNPLGELRELNLYDDPA